MVSHRPNDSDLATSLQEILHYVRTRAAALGAAHAPPAAGLAPEMVAAAAALDRRALSLLRRPPGRPKGTRDSQPRRPHNPVPAGPDPSRA
jgi:hypothetical protein